MSSGQERRISKGVVKKNAWTAEEDMQLVNYINRFGIWNWTQMPRFAGLTRSGKSCRLRWKNYLNPNIRRGNYSQEEDEIIISMRQTMGAGWSAIAEKLPGRTDNEIKNRWHTHLKKRLQNNPIEEDMKAEIGMTSNSTCSNYSSPNYISHAPSASDPESANHKSPISSSNMLNDLGFNTSTDDLSIFESYYNQMTDDELPNFDSSETIEDPLEIFWREKFSLENDLMEDDHLETNYGQYNPELLSMPQNSYEEPMGPYNCSNNYDYWFNLQTVGMDLDEKMGVHF